MSSKAIVALGEWALCAWVLCACAGSTGTGASADREASAVAAQAAAPGTLLRSQVVTVVDRGLGEFLQRVELEPSLEGGRFRGFRVLALTPPEFWAGVDLHPGDVVTHVNGQFVEDPNVVFEAFTGLKSARELRVDALRAGRPLVLRFPIVGDARPQTSPVQATASVAKLPAPAASTK